jgi:hypothetical protein
VSGMTKLGPASCGAFSSAWSVSEPTSDLSGANLKAGPRIFHFGLAEKTMKSPYVVDSPSRSFSFEVDQEPFQQGYIAGWHSVRGVDDRPVLIPVSPVFIAHAMYMVGFSRGVRDAG